MLVDSVGYNHIVCGRLHEYLNIALFVAYQTKILDGWYAGTVIELYLVYLLIVVTR